jgi:hypothetical protein
VRAQFSKINFLLFHDCIVKVKVRSSSLILGLSHLTLVMLQNGSLHALCKAEQITAQTCIDAPALSQGKRSRSSASLAALVLEQVVRSQLLKPFAVRVCVCVCV